MNGSGKFVSINAEFHHYRLVSPRLRLSTPAARLGGIEAPDSSEVARITKEFLDDELASKPLGFYNWSEELRRIFQQDRLLQRELEPDDIERVKAAFDAEPTAKAAYRSHLEIIERLTNPPSAKESDLLSGGKCFFPPSRSHESDLVERVFRARAIPDGFSLADEMIKRMRDGSLKLYPTEAAGWYDFQTWALEPLVVPERMPEAARLKMDDRYRKQLEDLFKATLALTRETHVKQLKMPSDGAARGLLPQETSGRQRERANQDNFHECPPQISMRSMINPAFVSSVILLRPEGIARIEL